METARNGGEDVSAAKEGLSVVHEFCDGVVTIADAFLELSGDEGGGFVDVELESASETLLGQKASLFVVAESHYGCG